jgi:hypothetical protein
MKVISSMMVLGLDLIIEFKDWLFPFSGPEPAALQYVYIFTDGDATPLNF